MERVRRFPVTGILIAINVLLFFVVDFTGGTDDLSHMVRCGAAYPAFIIEQKEYYRLVSSMFLHFGIEHLLNNMLVLGAFGERVEPALGKVRFLIVYLLGGIGGNLISLAWQLHTGSQAVSAGASGAVFAVLGAMIAIVLYHRGRYQEISIRRLLIMSALSLYLGFVSGGVDNAAHLGGLLTGFVLTFLLYRGGRRSAKEYHGF